MDLMEGDFPRSLLQLLVTCAAYLWLEEARVVVVFRAFALSCLPSLHSHTQSA